MSVSGRAGAGGGGPHQGALPQTAEAIWLCRFGARKYTDGRKPRRAVPFAAENWPPFFSLPEAKRVPKAQSANGSADEGP